MFCQLLDMKLQKEFIDTKTYIEHLSDEIFYQIFDYLDGYDIYQAFSNLNNRLENLINSSFMKIQFSSTSELDHHYIQFLISKKHQIFSLHFNNEQILKTFIRLRMIQSFNHLESVILNPVSTYKFLTILFYFVSVPRLSSLTICFNDYLNNLRDIFGVINDLLHLKYLKFKLLSCNIANIAARTSRNEKMTTIKYLVIHFGCAHNQLTNLLFHLPQLIHLTCDYLMKSNNDVELEMVQLNHLMYLDVVIENIDFNEFETFLFKLCYRLKILRIKDGSFIFASNSNKSSSNSTIVCSTGVDSIKTLPSTSWLPESKPVEQENEYRLPMVTHLLSLPFNAFVKSSSPLNPSTSTPVDTNDQ